MGNETLAELAKGLEEAIRDPNVPLEYSPLLLAVRRRLNEDDHMNTFIEFVLLWITREKVTDEERVSVIKYHPFLQDIITRRAENAAAHNTAERDAR